MFKIFPEFSKLTFADREEYEGFIRGLPPLADISFSGLMLWWNFLDSCAVSRLGENLIISYWLPGDEQNSGLCLIGTDGVDESICAVLDHLKATGAPVRLVHVPEFVVSNMQHPDMFTFIPERDYDEWVYATSGVFPLSNATKRAQTKIKAFLSQVDKSHIKVGSLDLGQEQDRRLLQIYVQEWYRQGGSNDIGKLEMDALNIAIMKAAELRVENICLFIDGELAGFQMYCVPHNKQYVISMFSKVNCTLRGAFEYMFYIAAQHFSELGASFINYEQDLGIQTLRAEKLTLGPVNFFRKYTINPV